MLASVWRKAIEQLFAECHALFLKHFQRPRHRMDVVQDDHVGHEVVVFHDLSLLVANVFRNDSVVREVQPLGEVVELLALVRRLVDHAAQLDIVDVVQQELGSYCSTELAEREIQLVLPARSEEHTSELQSLMRLSYAVFCLKNKLTLL